MKVCFNKIVGICPERAKCKYEPTNKCPEGLKYQEEEIKELDYSDTNKLMKIIRHN